MACQRYSDVSDGDHETVAARGSVRQSRSPVAVEVAGRIHRPTAAEPVRAPAMPWWAAAASGAMVCLLAGWVLVSAPVVLGTLTGAPRPLASAFAAATHIWLLAHGGTADFGGVTISIVPLGLSLIFMVMLMGVSSWAARQAQLRFPDDNLPISVRATTVVRVAAVLAICYASGVAVVDVVVNDASSLPDVVAGSLLLATTAGLIGAARTVAYDATESWPSSLRPLPGAVASGALVVIIGGALALATTMYRRREAIATLAQNLGPDPAGSVVLALGQAAYVPNLMLWSSSWVLGAGFSLGDGSVVSPSVTALGMLPSIPILGALPPEAVGQTSTLPWLVVGVIAGVVAGWRGTRSSTERFDQTALVGGMIGVVTGLVVTALAVLSGGDLGVARLTGIGPRLTQLLVMSCSLIGLSGLVTGFVVGLLSWRRQIAARTSPRSVVSPATLSKDSGGEDSGTEDSGTEDSGTVLLRGKNEDSATVLLPATTQDTSFTDQEPDVTVVIDDDPTNIVVRPDPPIPSDSPGATTQEPGANGTNPPVG